MANFASIQILQQTMMLTEFQKYVKDSNLFSDNSTILLTVSGGIDSMCMCDLFLRSGYHVAMAHCNFQLRGDDAEKDELFVRSYAQAKNIPLHVIRFETSTYAANNGISIQMAARDLRYKWFEELCVIHGYDKIATAHHLDDQAETFFINLIRGTGIAGLHGILPVSGKLIRPLLFATRKDIENYFSEHNLVNREDLSNNSDKYLRNRLRHKVLPLIEEIEPEFVNKLANTTDIIRKGEQIIQAAIEQAKIKLISRSEAFIAIDKNELMCLNPADYYLFEILKDYGYNYSQVNDIIEAISGTSGKQFFSADYQLTIGRKSLLVYSIRNKADAIEYIFGEDFEQIDDPFCLHMQREQIDIETFQIPSDRNIACLDGQLLTFPLVLRRWKQGDYFYPLGMENKKLISDYFIDEKFEITEKAEAWLLLSGDDVIWITGHRIDNRYRVTKTTQEIVRFTKEI